jgi:hypothetical protein
MTTTTPIDDWADQISGAMMQPLRQVGLLLAREIEGTQSRIEDLEVYVRAMERRLERLEERVL